MADYKKKSVKKVKLNDAPKPRNKKAKKTVIPQNEKPEKQIQFEVPAKAINKKKPNIKKKAAPQKKTPKTAKTGSAALSPKKKRAGKKLNAVNFNIISGEEAISFFSRHRSIIVILSIVLLIFIFSLLTPTGLFEFVQNYSASIGSDKMPKNIVGTQIIGADSYDEVHVLTDIAYTLYNKNGKTINSDTHGFSNPVMRSSQARTLLFEQNGTAYKIYNYSGTVTSATCKEKILNGTICRNGSYAIISKPSDYAAKVEVFDSSDESVFSWSSAKEIITDACLSNNGKTLAVALVYSAGGDLTSKVLLFNYKSAHPVSTIELSCPVLSLKTLNSDTFVAVCDTRLEFVDFDNYTRKTVELGGKVKYFRRLSSYKFCVAAESKRNNLQTRLLLINDDIETEYDATFNGSAEDVTYCDDYFYCLDDNKLYKVSVKGKALASIECSYSARRIFMDGKDTAFVVADNNINKIQIGG